MSAHDSHSHEKPCGLFHVEQPQEDNVHPANAAAGCRKTHTPGRTDEPTACNDAAVDKGSGATAVNPPGVPRETVTLGVHRANRDCPWMDRGSRSTRLGSVATPSNARVRRGQTNRPPGASERSARLLSTAGPRSVRAPGDSGAGLRGSEPPDPGCSPGCTGGDSSPAPGLLRHSGREACWRPPCRTWRRPTQGPSASQESQGLPRHASYPTPSETRSALEVRPCFTWNIPSRCTRVDRVSLYSARRFAAVRGGRQRPNPTNPLGFRPAEPLRGTEWAAPAPQASRRTGSSGGAHTPATPWNNCRAGDPRRTRGDPAAHVRRPSPLPEEAVQEAPPRALSVGRGPGRSGARSAVRAFAVVRRLFGCRPIRQARDRAPRTLGPVVPPPRHFRTSMTRFWRSAWDTPGIRPA